MKSGVWHQLGDKSQLVAYEQLENGVGVGVAVSARDLSYSGAEEHTAKYRALGAEIIFDPQYYLPAYSNNKLETYPFSSLRLSAQRLGKITDDNLSVLAKSLEEINRKTGSIAIVAPAIIYEANRPDILSINKKLHAAAKKAGDALGIPTFGTVILGSSTNKTTDQINSCLADILDIKADGWYYSFEFGDERIPSTHAEVYRCAVAGLTLAQTGRPVFHAYAGPMALLAPAFGCIAAGVGHSQNIWQFKRERWEPPQGQGGGGDAPSRYFSKDLWGTIVYPDEFTAMPVALRNRILCASPYTAALTSAGDSPLKRWDSNKHLIHTIATAVQPIFAQRTARLAAAQAIAILDVAIKTHADIAVTGLGLADKTSSYQYNWKLALEALVAQHKDGFDYLELIR